MLDSMTTPAASPPHGLVPKTLLAERDVDVHIACVPSFEQTDGYPETLLERAHVKYVLMGHWEDFFQSRGEALKPLRNVLDEASARSPIIGMLPDGGVQVNLQSEAQPVRRMGWIGPAGPEGVWVHNRAGLTCLDLASGAVRWVRSDVPAQLTAFDPCFGKQFRHGGDDLPADALGTSDDIDAAAPQTAQLPVIRPNAELQFRAADFDAEIHAPPSQRNPPVQIVHDPVERRQVDGLDDAHVIEGDVEIVLSQRAQFAAAEAGAAECF